MSLGVEDPQMMLHVRDGILYLVALILSICVHEFGHAFVADKLGDPLPRAQGRVTLNPLAHIDPIGTLLLPIAGFAMSISSPAIGSRILGWGKPVQVSLSARHINRKMSIQTASAIISLAGPMMNLVFGLLLSVIVVLMMRASVSFEITAIVFNVIAMNIGLAIFNLIPCPPLDGGAVLRRLLPRSMEFISDTLERYGSMILFGLLMSGVLVTIMGPARWVTQQWADVLVSLANPK